MTEVNKAREDLVTHADLKRLFWMDRFTGDLRRLTNRPNSPVNSVAGFIDNSVGYRKIKIKNVRYYAHRLVWLYYYGEWPDKSIDHIDGNKLNNRIENLRVVTHQENHKNRQRASNNTSGVTGVGVHTQTKKWRSRIRVDDELIHLGVFDNFEDAVAARKAAERKYNFHPNHGRR